jgi:ABC-type transport system involved in multi-copper enzyme maturation permease subunit
MNAVLSKLWLWFWHLLPANPILVRVVHGGSRRTRHLYLRAGYLVILTVVVLFSLFPSMTGQSPSLADLAKDASQTFMYASMAQLALMCFLAPVFTAGAITQERDAQTFNILLATPLSNAQIVFGSLMSRLFFVIVLLVAGLPIFLMTMVYGGVTTIQVTQSFMLSASTAILTGAIAIFIAMIGVGTRRTIFSFYVVIAFYLLSVYLLGRWSLTWVDSAAPNIDGRKMSWLAALHPFMALEVALNQVYAPPVGRLADRSGLVRYALAYPSAVYVTWTMLVALALTLASIFFVRRGAKTGETTFWTALIDRFRRTPPGERTRPPRNVWNNPVAWREAKTRASGGRLLRLVIIAAGFAGPMALFVYQWRGGLGQIQVPEWLAALVIIQFVLALVIATNTAATSMTKEKESKTIDLLLTTTLTSKYILWGKLRGLVSFAMPLIAGPVIVLLLFGLYGLAQETSPPIVWVETAVELSLLMLVYAAGACVLGLYVSLNSRKNVTAVMYSVGMVLLGGGVASLLVWAFVTNAGGQIGACLAPFAPFTSIKYLVHPAALFGAPKEFLNAAGSTRVCLALGTVLAVCLYVFIIWRLYTSLVRNFDMTLRKQSATQ